MITTRLPALVLSLVAMLPLATRAGQWKVVKADNPDLPGQNVSFTEDGQVVARFIYGPGQPLPYVAVYDRAGRLLTNPGMDREGKLVGIEPHHRGIFIGWQQVKCDLGTVTFWGIGSEASKKKGEAAAKMDVVAIEKTASDRDSGTVVARIEWRAGNHDASGSNLVVTETRTITVRRPAGSDAQIDTTFQLVPARDLVLDGNVQHAGVHMRVAQQVIERATETSYLWSPASAPTAGKAYMKGSSATGSVVGQNLQWGEFLFPLHDRWYTVLQLNSPKNPVEEFSTREYGRFGFFFKKELKRGENLEVKYRFLVQDAAAPAQPPKRSPEQLAAARREADAAYAKFVAELR